MGCSNAKFPEIPTNPLQELQFNEAKRKQRLHQNDKNKRQKQIDKIQKKHVKKQKKILSSTQFGRRYGDDHGNRVQNDTTTDQHNLDVNFSKIKNNNNSLDNHAVMEEVISTSEYDHQERYKDDIDRRTRIQLEHDLCAFLINQIVLTTEFFENYEIELESIYEELLDQENAYSQNLTDHSIMFANPLDEAVSRHIQYQSVINQVKHSSLQAQLMYVIFENIDIARPNDANYDSISPLCKVLIETDYYRTTPCKQPYVKMMREIKWKGYVRLKLREFAGQKREKANDDDDDDDRNKETFYITDSSSGYSSSTSDYRNGIMKVNSQPENYYDYVYIESLNTHHPIMDLTMINKSKSNDDILTQKVLPEFCVSQLSSFIEPWIEDTDTDEHEEEVEKSSSQTYNIDQDQDQGLLQQSSYLNSKQFMHYFGELMRRQLAAQLNISESQMANGTYCGCSIYTNDFEIVPAIHVTHNWPDCAFSFRIRDRPLAKHPITGEQIQWPTKNMIKRIESFGFHVVPMGYAPKRYRNPFRELEWRIVFPKAERYLEQHLTRTQVKVYMLAKALVKTFVESQEKSKTLWFAFDHLRVHLFWECERNYTAWPEEFLGDVLVKFIRSFMACLRTKKLPDYFIEERNLFENIPEDSLAALHAFLNDIVEYPLMHLLVAMRHLKNTENDDFYPKLNLHKLFENLVEYDIFKLKQLSRPVGADSSFDVMDSVITKDIDMCTNDILGKQQATAKGRRLGNQQKQSDWNSHCDSPFGSFEVDPSIIKKLRIGNHKMVSRNLGIENLRRTNLLELLLKHTLAMQEKATNVYNLKLAQLYIEQARRLCNYYHDLGCDLNAKEYFNEISQAEIKIVEIEDHHKITTNAIIHVQTQLAPPALPKRFTKESSVATTNSDAVNNLSFTGPKNLSSTSKTKQNNKNDNDVNDDDEDDDDDEKDVQLRNESDLVSSSKLSIEILDKPSPSKVKNESKLLQKLTKRTEQIITQTVKSDEKKYVDLCDLFKRQITIKLQETLNKTSES